ncbi:MAG: endolytic transglycosylase MltG, partial [Proteobacteria bacterium]|nr:endolytic transglycosylase MltG [Pseudomonadota bacterium]
MIAFCEKKFLLLARLRHAGSKIKSGELRFYKNMNPLEVLDNLLNGIPVLYSFTVPEGFNMYQIAQILEEKGIIKHASDFITASKDKKIVKELGIKADSVEGYLFPDTYTVEKVRDVKTLIKLMYKKYKQIFTPQMIERAHELGLTEYEIITLASIIEKETGAVDERRKIASVFYNRIKKGMRLQSDPTTIYGLWDTYRGNLTKDDLQKYTPYNTYKIFGLPPGPIASPGKESIMAALYPEKTNYLFFVSKNDGTHTFTAYKDGVKDQAFINGNRNSGTDSAQTAYLFNATYFDGAAYTFNGLADEFKISNVARSDDWIKTEYNNQSSPGTFYSVASEESANSTPGAPTSLISAAGNNQASLSWVPPVFSGGSE